MRDKPEEKLDKTVARDLSKIEVVGDLSEYVREYLAKTNVFPDVDSLIVTVDSDSPLSSKSYLQIADEVEHSPDPSYVYIQAEQMSVEQHTLTTYLQARGIKYTFSLQELASWL